MPLILIAEDPIAMPYLREALEPHALIECVDTQDALKKMSDQDIDFFVVGIHFDESRGVDLVTLIRNEDRYKETPILVVRLLKTHLGPFLKENMGVLKTLWPNIGYMEFDEAATDSTLKRELQKFLPLSLLKDD
jgi:hypothetical protein